MHNWSFSGLVSGEAFVIFVVLLWSFEGFGGAFLLNHLDAFIFLK